MTYINITILRNQYFRHTNLYSSMYITNTSFSYKFTYWAK